jgi:cell division protein FtsW (lipid II flippase)
MVTLAFGGFLILSLGITVLTAMLIFGLFDLLLLILLVPYIMHYFKLENGVQRWYHIANEIEKRRGKVYVDYQKRESKKMLRIRRVVWI